MSSKKNLMKSGKAAAFLGVGQRTFQRLVKAGELVPDVVTATGYNLFSKETLSRFGSKARQTAQTATRELETVSKRAMVILPVLPGLHFSGVTKLMRKLQAVEVGCGFKTAFDKGRTLFIFARLDYADERVSFSGRFDVADELILNSLYSLTRNATADSDGSYPVGEKPTFSSRRILQHIFGNVADHFQDEIVEFVERRLERLSWMKLTFDLRDNLGNSKAITVRGEKYRPVALRENLLDMTVIDFENETRERKFPVYKLNRKSPIFMYAENLNQITSWSAHYMACRTVSAILCK